MDRQSLVQAEVDGEKLTPIELLAFPVLLLVAGNETTTNLIGAAIRVRAEDSATWTASARTALWSGT